MKYIIGDNTFFLICNLIEAIERLDNINPNDLDDCDNALDDTNEARAQLINCIASVAIGDYVMSQKQTKGSKR